VINLLNISNLTVSIKDKILFKNFNLSLKKGEKVAINGPSGCGKSTIGKAIINLLAPEVKILSGSIFFNGVNVHKFPKKKLKIYRGKSVGYIFQSAVSVLNPMDKIINQIVETYKSHYQDCLIATIRDKCINILAQLGMGNEEGERVINSYPFQLSGGQAARVYTTLISILEPKIIIADEVFSELDELNKIKMVKYLSKLAENGKGIIIISHNQEVVKSFTDNIFTLA